MSPISGFCVSESSPDSLTDQIRLQVRQAVAEGRLAEGQRLPSLRTMARDLNVSLNTVERALRDLMVEGVLESQQGRGVFVAAKPTRRRTLRMSPCRCMSPGERERVLANFRAANPCAEVVLTDESPDLVEMEASMAARLDSELEDIDDLVCALYGREEQDRDVFNSLRVNGVLRMLPVVWGHSVMLLNADLLRAAGVAEPPMRWTCQQCLEIARACARKGGAVSGFASTNHCTAFFLDMVFQNGGGLFDPAGNYCRITEPEAVEAAEFLRALFAFDTAEWRSLDDVGTGFAQGRVAMFPASNWRWQEVKNCGFPVLARPFPAARQAVTTLSGSGFGVRRGSAARDLAIGMLKVLAGMELWDDHAAGAPAVPFSRSLEAPCEVVNVYRASLRQARTYLHEVTPRCRTGRHLETLNLIPHAVRSIRSHGSSVQDALVSLREQVNALIRPSEAVGLRDIHDRW